MSDALDAVLPRLRCPHCAAPLAREGAAVACAGGHRYDVARQGYVALFPPGGRRHGGDSAAMVAARAAFLDGGHFAPLTSALVAAARDALSGGAAGACALDVGAGTGHQLAAVVDALPEAHGIALDVAAPALRRAARAHPRVAAVGADAWGGLPLRDGAADLALVVFAPRAGAELARVLAPGAAAIVATPLPHHLAELRAEVGLIGVDPAKPERLRAALAPALMPIARREVAFPLALDHDGVRALVAMGPSARHVDDLDARVARLPAPLAVTAAVAVETFSAPPAASR